MTKELKFYEIPPLSNQKVEKLVVFLHGYGANGQDLINLSYQFQNTIPAAHFISPNAPLNMNNSFLADSYAWFSLGNYDPQILYPQILEANKILDNFLEKQLKRFGLNFKDLILIGFSQGSMMAMYNSLRRDKETSKVISCSGKLILPIWLGEKVKSKPKICLIHGKEDNVLPFDNFLEAEKLLRSQEIPFSSYPLDNLGHNIDQRVIKISQNFLLS